MYKLAVPLCACTAEKQAIIRIVLSESVKKQEIHRKMLQQYGDTYTGERVVGRCI